MACASRQGRRRCPGTPAGCRAWITACCVLLLAASPGGLAADETDVRSRASAVLREHLAAWQGVAGAGNLRLRISAEPVVLALVRWDGAGARTHPPPGTLPHVSEERVLADLPRLEALRDSDPLPAWEAVRRGSDQYYWCEERTCLQVSGGALFDALGLPPQNHGLLLQPGPAAPRGAGLAALAIPLAIGLGAGAFLYWRRSGQKLAPASPATAPPAPDGFVFAHATVDADRLVLTDATGDRDLSRREVALLRLFAENPGTVFSKDQLYDAGWGRAYQPSSRALDQQILTLRRKLDPERVHGAIIETVHGRGYRYRA